METAALRHPLSLPAPWSDAPSVLVDPIPDKPASLVRPGYAFLYWCTTPDGSGEAYTEGNYHRFWENTVLYAIWGKDITLRYDANGGTGTVPASVSGQPYLNVTIASPDNLSKEGAQFMWWNTRPDGSGTGYKGDGSDSFVITEDTTLYAIWTDDSGKIIPSPGTGESRLPMDRSYIHSYDGSQSLYLIDWLLGEK